MDHVMLHYAGAYLDRGTDTDYEPHALESYLHSEWSRVVPLWCGQSLVRRPAGEPPHAVSLGRRELETLRHSAAEPILLGFHDRAPVFAVDVPSGAEHALVDPADAVGFQPLREIGAALGASDAHVLAYAKALIHWHRRHRFCGLCGAATVSRRGGHLRVCSNEACAGEHYPRTDPAVIVLVTEPGDPGSSPRCLLARHARLPARVYTTLAGFVEPGECLEETVIREVWEEVGIPVTAVTYQASQPWPFPAQVMLGFRASASRRSIRADRVEIEKAHWFRADEVQAAGEWGNEAAEIQLPRPDSIARYLIDEWVRDSS